MPKIIELPSCQYPVPDPWFQERDCGLDIRYRIEWEDGTVWYVCEDHMYIIADAADNLKETNGVTTDTRPEL